MPSWTIIDTGLKNAHVVQPHDQSFCCMLKMQAKYYKQIKIYRKLVCTIYEFLYVMNFDLCPYLHPLLHNIIQLINLMKKNISIHSSIQYCIS